MKCTTCGKWAGAHATLPGQPTDHLCRCPPAVSLKQWKVIRHVREEFFVEADTKAEALLNIQDPYTVTVTKQTCVRA